MSKPYILKAAGLLCLILCHMGCGRVEQSAFFVEANCRECVEILLEKAENLSGVTSAKWIEKSSFLEVRHRYSSQEEIQEELSLNGFATQFYLANDSASALLPACCSASLQRELEIYVPDENKE